MKAIIKLDIPDWQIGQEVSVYFPDTMVKKSICEKETGYSVNKELLSVIDDQQKKEDELLNTIKELIAENVKLKRKRFPYNLFF